MSPCKTSPAATPLQLSLRGGLTAAAWFRALGDIAEQLPPGAAQTALADVHRRVGEALRRWIADEELAPGDPAAALWRHLLQGDAGLAAAVAKSLASAEQVIGRETFAAQW